MSTKSAAASAHSQRAGSASSRLRTSPVRPSQYRAQPTSPCRSPTAQTRWTAMATLG